MEIDLVPGEVAVGRSKKVIERDFIESRRGGISRDMSTQAAVGPVGIHDHGHGIPPGVTLKPPLHFPVAREGGLFVRGDGVHVRRAHDARTFAPVLPQAIRQALEEAAPCPGLPAAQRVFDYRFQRVQDRPLPSRLRFGQDSQFRFPTRDFFVLCFQFVARVQFVRLLSLDCPTMGSRRKRGALESMARFIANKIL